MEQAGVYGGWSVRIWVGGFVEGFGGGIGKREHGDFLQGDSGGRDHGGCEEVEGRGGCEERVRGANGGCWER